jgi:hypothetical protein
MVKKLSDQMVKRLKTVGIKAKNEDDAREQLLDFLNKQGIEGMEEEDTDSLIEMAESFGDEDVDIEDEKSEDEEADELADEAEEEEEEEEEEDSDDSNDEEETDEEDEEEEEEQPKKKTAKAEKKEAKKPAAKKQISKRGVKLNPKANDDDQKYFKPLHKLFDPKDYVYAWLSTAGVNIKNKGKNSNRALVLIENCTLKNIDGKETLTCNLYFPILNKKTEILEENDIDFETCWNGAPFIKEITFDEAIEIIKQVFDYIIGLVNKIDKKLGDNRKKMEDSLKKSSKKSTKKVEEPEDDEEEEDEAEEEQPKKKTAKKATKKSKK